MTGININDIDTSPPLNQKFPTNCRIIGCHSHCTIPEQLADPSDEELINNLEHHGITYHRDLLNATPASTLSIIGWYKCLIGCPNIAFTIENHHKHQMTCAIYQQNQQPTMNNKRAAPTSIGTPRTQK
jgi:hypothetical protein